MGTIDANSLTDILFSPSGRNNGLTSIDTIDLVSLLILLLWIKHRVSRLFKGCYRKANTFPFNLCLVQKLFISLCKGIGKLLLFWCLLCNVRILPGQFLFYLLTSTQCIFTHRLSPPYNFNPFNNAPKLVAASPLSL